MSLEATIRTVVREELEHALRAVLPGLLAEMVKPPAGREPLFTVEDVARICRTEPKVVRGWIKRGKLRATRPGHQYLVEPAALERMLTGIALAKAPVSDDEQVRNIMGSLERRHH